MSAKPAKGNARSSGYDRNENDWYVEPAWSVEALLRTVTFEGICWDPACGGGNIPRTLEAHGLDCLATDLVDRGFGQTPIDFLLSNHVAHNIITIRPSGFLWNSPSTRSSRRPGRWLSFRGSRGSKARSAASSSDRRRYPASWSFPAASRCRRAGQTSRRRVDRPPMLGSCGITATEASRQ